MPAFDWIRNWFTGTTAKRSYSGASLGRLGRGTPEMASINLAIHQARGTLARRARFLAANNALAASAVEAWVSALVAYGIKPQAAHDEEDVRAALNLGFDNWTVESDADGVADFYGQQAIMARRLVVDGEAFALLINTEQGLRIRLLDAEQVDASLTRDLEGGVRIVQGVEFDASGRRIAYHVLPDRSGIPFAAMPLTATRVPAEDIIHVFRPETPGQVRGVTWFAPVLLRVGDMDQWRHAQLTRQKIAAMLAGFIEQADGGGSPMEGEQVGGTLTGGLEPGTLKYLGLGEKITFSTPANIGDEVIQFAKITEREIAVGMGLPASVLTGDLSDANYGSIRSGLVEWRKRIEATQNNILIHQGLRPIWRRFATIEVLAGRVDTTVAAALPVKFITPRQAWIDPKKDVEAELMAINGGLMSRREAVTSRGINIEELDAEIAADAARAKRLGLTFTSPANDNPPLAADDAA